MGVGVGAGARRCGKLSGVAGRNGEEEEQGVVQGVVLLLRQGVRRREDFGAAPEGQALQMPRLPQEALHRRWHGHSCPPGPQRDRHQVCFFLFFFFFFWLPRLDSPHSLQRSLLFYYSIFVFQLLC